MLCVLRSFRLDTAKATISSETATAQGFANFIDRRPQLYGDEYYNETTGATQPGNRRCLFNEGARLPSLAYYYENYPENYEVYQVVETPVYRRQIEQVYYTDAAPVFVRTSSPTVTSIKIKSPYDGRSMSKNFPKPAKPTKEEKEFGKNNPAPPEFVVR